MIVFVHTRIMLSMRRHASFSSSGVVTLEVAGLGRNMIPSPIPFDDSEEWLDQLFMEIEGFKLTGRFLLCDPILLFLDHPGCDAALSADEFLTFLHFCFICPLLLCFRGFLSPKWLEDRNTSGCCHCADWIEGLTLWWW
jgi:hypothetical protein